MAETLSAREVSYAATSSYVGKVCVPRAILETGGLRLVVRDAVVGQRAKMRRSE